MTASESTSCPPRLAAWLVDLFAAPPEANAVLGDLAEDYSDVLEHEGARQARRSYWRQALSTVRDLALSPFRHDAQSGFAVSLGGIALGLGIGLTALAFALLMNQATSALARTAVSRYPIYHYLPASNYWNGVDLLPSLITGFVVALTARALKFRPMSAALAVVATLALLLAVETPIVIGLYGRPPFRHITFAFLLVRWARGTFIWGGCVALGAIAGRKIPMRGKSVRPGLTALG